VTARAPLTPELVEQRLAELQQLSRLGASLAEADLPPIDRRLLERRSLRIVGRALGHGSDVRDVPLHVLPTVVDRQLGWMPDAWVDPTSGAIVGVGIGLLAGASVDERSVDALPRGRAGIVVVRFLAERPACVDLLPLFAHPDPQPRLWLCSSRDRAHARW
jgi:hypothetical protein